MGSFAHGFVPASLNVQAQSHPLDLPWGCRVWILLMWSAVLGWHPGEEAHTTPEGNSRTPRCMVWETSVDKGCGHPLGLTDSSPWRRPDGGFVATLVFIEPPLPQCQWTSGWRDPLGDDGSNASTGRGQSSHSSHSRRPVSHTLIPGLWGKGGAWKIREMDCF